MATVTNLHHLVAAMKQVGVPPRRVGRVWFDDNDYVLSHARHPSGFGSWAFECDSSGINVSRLCAVVDAMNNQPGIVGRATVDHEKYLVRVWMPCGTYGSSRAAAARLLAAFTSGAVRVAT